MKITKEDEIFLNRCLYLAKKGIGNTYPNPLVGCVITKNKKIIAEGYHKVFGKEHAEINALKKINYNAPANSTLYVNLEPCNHFGNTPPCTDAIIKSKIKKVIIAKKDFNPLTAGNGIKKLIKNNIEVINYNSKKAVKLNEVFFKWIKTRIPFFTLKLALSLDGKLATSTGDSKYFTSKQARVLTHKIRFNHQAILVGINTILKDNPLLTPYLIKQKKLIPYYRIILDEEGLIPLNFKVLNCTKTFKTIIVTKKMSLNKIHQLNKKNVEVFIDNTKDKKINLQNLTNFLFKKNISNVLIEGGGEIVWSFFKAKLIDKFYFFYALLIIGGNKSISSFAGEGFKYINNALNFVKIKDLKIQNIGKDILLKGYFNYSKS